MTTTETTNERKETMKTIKKIEKKAFHLGNRLNGDGAKNRAGYGVFENGELIGRVSFCSVYDAYSIHPPYKRINSYSTSTLKQLREQLAKM